MKINTSRFKIIVVMHESLQRSKEGYFRNINLKYLNDHIGPSKLCSLLNQADLKASNLHMHRFIPRQCALVLSIGIHT
jgi:hypothetical protein